MKSSVFEQSIWCKVCGFISIPVLLSTFYEVFKYFQTKQFAQSNQIPGWLSTFLQFLLSNWGLLLIRSIVTIWQRKTVRSCGKVCYLSGEIQQNVAEIFKSECHLEANIHKTNLILNKEPQRTSISKLVSVETCIWQILEEAYERAASWPNVGVCCGRGE